MYIRKRGELTVFVKQFGGWENISLKLRDSLQTKRKQNFFAHTKLLTSGGRSPPTLGWRSATTLRTLIWSTQGWRASTTLDPKVTHGNKNYWIFFFHIESFLQGWSCIFLCTLSFPQGPWKRESERGLVWGSGRLNAEAEIRASLCITLYYPPIVKYVQHLHQEYKS